MIKNSFVYLIFAILFVFVGCSSKKFFEPTKIDSFMKFKDKLTDHIQTSNRFGAVLKNGSVITQNGVSYIKLDKNSLFLNDSDDYYIITQKCDQIELINKKTQESIFIPVDTCALSASIKADKLAVILADNSTNIYDIKTKEILFSQKGTPSIAINSLLSAPIFLDTLVVFPTLDGRLLVVDEKSYSIVRNIIINSEKFFNNVIYLMVDGENMFAATPKRIMSIISGREFSYDADIRDILYDKNYLYVLTLEGQIIQLDKTLRETNKVKLPFATLNAIVVIGNKLYTIEKTGYLIELNIDNFTYKVIEVKGMFGKKKLDKINFYDKNRIYYDQYYIDFTKE
ncbi:hypothetical protein Q5I06_08040 [Helicobacter sp. faydin-H76]|uniref:Plasminogen-binding protein pgbB n=1 Tax=Helicobacter cappadocius TaxID=3063998 RepID=A0AA90TCJ0_9HELI|nr:MULTISPECIES: hypothetical protein [unclassified Helicobacter]MDO7253832.1 hypothetical protein [Helicobacter sp. faydin-H75]MDP2539721.1 hypothetical protein [Helicobacter sp. faydin-H76]